MPWGNARADAKARLDDVDDVRLIPRQSRDSPPRSDLAASPTDRAIQSSPKRSLPASSHCSECDRHSEARSDRRFSRTWSSCSGVSGGFPCCARRAFIVAMTFESSATAASV